MNLKLQMIIFSMLLSLFGYGMLWYLTDWKITLTVLILFWGTNLQNLVVGGKFDD